MKPTNVTGYPFSNGDRLTAISVNQICNALDAIQDYNDTIKEFEDLLHEEISSTTESTVVAVNDAVGKMDSVSLASDVAQGKVNIAAAINAKGGTADPMESFQQLAQDIEALPVYNEFLRLFFVTCGGSYNKNAVQGVEENDIADVTELNDNGLTFNYIMNMNYQFQNWNRLTSVFLNKCTTINANYLFTGCYNLAYIEMLNLTAITAANSFNSCGCVYLRMPSLVSITGLTNVFIGCTFLQEVYMPKLQNLATSFCFQYCSDLRNIVFGTLTNINYNWLSFTVDKLRNITVGDDTNIDLPFGGWRANTVIAEGATGIAELNDNLYNNLLTKLYDHSNDGITRTLQIGWLSNVTAENVAYANAKGWTLTT